MKKAQTLKYRTSDDGLISPIGEAIRLVAISPNNHEKAKQMNKTLFTNTSKAEMKKSRQIALQMRLRSLFAKRRLSKVIRMVYLVSMFISIAKQTNYQNKLRSQRVIKKKWLIYPVIHIFIIAKEDKLKQIWDIFMLLVLVYSSIYIPYVAAFIDDPDVYDISKYILSGIFSITVDKLVIDITILMRMCYYDKHGQLVQSYLPILRNYFSGWFLIDVISAIPYSECQLFKILRIGRVQTIISSSSLNQNKILEFIIDIFDLKQAYLIQVIFFSFIGFHYAACLWALSIVYSDGKQPEYMDAAYWAMQTLSTVGYGDILPTSMLEYLTSIIAMLSGGMFMSIVIGNLSGILQDMDAQSQFIKINSEYQSLFSKVLIFHEYQKEIKTFLIVNHKHNQSWALSQQEWFQILPRNIQNKVLLYATRKEILSVSLFKIQISFALKAMRHISFMKAKAGNLIWLKGDPVEEICLLVEGVIQYRNQFGKELLEIKAGAVFGEQEFFSKRMIQNFYGRQQRKLYAYAKEDCYYLIIRSHHFFHYLQEFPALQKYLTILAQHRQDDMLIRIKQYEHENRQERISQQRLELIKSANKIEINEYNGMMKPRKTIIYDSRSSNTESILNRVLENRKSKITMLMERFRKVVQMIIFANRTIDRQIFSSKSTSVQNSQTNILSKKIKPNQIVPLGILMKMKQKFVEIKKIKKISLQKKNEFCKIVQAFGYVTSPSPSQPQTKRKSFIYNDPPKEVEDTLIKLKSTVKALDLSIWLAKMNQGDLENEFQNINRFVEKLNLN